MNNYEQFGSHGKDPKAEIMALWNDSMVMGRNDYEGGEFQKIMMELNAGTITPDEALAKVHGMMDSKQDYN